MILYYNNMGRKRKKENEKKVTFHLNITKELIEEFKQECEKKGEIPSHIIEDLIKKYLK